MPGWEEARAQAPPLPQVKRQPTRKPPGGLARKAAPPGGGEGQARMPRPVAPGGTAPAPMPRLQRRPPGYFPPQVAEDDPRINQLPNGAKLRQFVPPGTSNPREKNLEPGAYYSDGTFIPWAKLPKTVYKPPLREV